MKFRAMPTGSGWKVERLVGGCERCKVADRWQTILYTYYPLTAEEQESIAKACADALNAAVSNG